MQVTVWDYLQRHVDMVIPYDAVVVPDFSDKDDAIRRNDIVATELTRCIQFGMWSKDPSCITQLRIIAVKHSIDDTLLTNNIGLEDE